MPYQALIRSTLSCCAALALGACSALSPPQMPREELAVSVSEHWQEELPSSTAPLSTQLLDLLGSPALNQLVEQTLAANYDLRQSALLVQEQQLLQRQTDAARLPEAALNLKSSDAKDSASSQTLSLDISWEADVWGRLADQSSVAQAQTQASQLDYRAAANSLAAQTIQLWLDIVLRERVMATETQWLTSLEHTQASIRESYSSGLRGTNALADLASARADTALIRVSLASRQQAQRAAYRTLAALQGKTDVAQIALPSETPSIANPPPLLPAQMIANRPDLQSAYLAIRADDASASATYKELLPSFSLSASLSQTRPQLTDLLSGSSAWSLLGSLSAPLFNAGRIKAKAKAARLKAQRSYLAYQQLLLNALGEVEAALGQEASLAEQQRQLERALSHLVVSRDHYSAGYSSGLNNILDLLSAKRSVFDTQIKLLETQQARLKNRITLGLALGMGV